MIRVIHTADWHIGQLFHEYDRSYEHQCFLDWLVNLLVQEQTDVLLISGDVFDQGNPSAASLKMFYSFLNRATRAQPRLQIIITAGNHDSAARLESPKPLLESSNIHIIGTVPKDETGLIDYDKMIIPLTNATGNIEAWCIAVPFLRIGDYPVIPDKQNPYAAGVSALYAQAFEAAAKQRKKGEAIIALGHLHAQDAEVSDMDNNERPIMGGLESIAATSFPKDIQYIALGHIHKAQRIGGKEHIRYSGSPLPMSFSEKNYKHQVIGFEITDGQAQNIHSIEVPVRIPLICVPGTHQPLEEVLTALQSLPAKKKDKNFSPFLEVRVLLQQPEPGMRHKIEKAIADKDVRLATIKPIYGNPQTRDSAQYATMEDLQALKPADLFKKVYTAKFNADVPAEMMKLFDEVVTTIGHKQEQA
ncbi:MAG: exonuclease SbcCD subunit D C-terminal domain-containing protein [Niabella sp.]